jgi:hypothetical protein
MEEKRDACSVLVGNPKRKEPFERTRRRWENNIKMNLKAGKAWIRLIWLRVGASVRPS